MEKKILVHCGNAPKMQRVIDLTVAVAERNFSAIVPVVREDFTWQKVGDDDIIHYSQLEDSLKNMKHYVTELNVENALSHGNGAMCEGFIRLEDGSSYHFCHVVKFVNTANDARIKSLHTYIVV